MYLDIRPQANEKLYFYQPQWSLIEPENITLLTSLLWVFCPVFYCCKETL